MKKNEEYKKVVIFTPENVQFIKNYMAGIVNITFTEAVNEILANCKEWIESHA